MQLEGSQYDFSKDDQQQDDSQYIDDQFQSNYYLNDKLRSKGINTSQYLKSSIFEKPKVNEKIDSQKIRELQIKLQIIPRSQNIFVNNTKLSFKRSEDSTMNLYSKISNQRNNINKYNNNSVNASINQSLNNYDLQKSQHFNQDSSLNYYHNLGQNQTTTEIQNVTSLRDALKKTLLKKETYTVQDMQNNESILIEKMFTGNTKYSSMYPTNKQLSGNIFLTQQSREGRHLNTQSQPNSRENSLTKKMSISSLNFHPQEVPQMRKFPQILPTLSDSMIKENIQKFMIP